MFKITGGKGFHITFANGYTVSVQFGAGNYCENRDGSYDDSGDLAKQGSATAETAVWGKDGKMLHRFPDDADTVQGWQTPEQVLATLQWVASK